jgi:hypothetical protein
MEVSPSRQYPKLLIQKAREGHLEVDPPNKRPLRESSRYIGIFCKSLSTVDW